MTKPRQDRVTLRLVPDPQNVPFLDAVVETFSKERLGFQISVQHEGSISFRWKTDAYSIEAEVVTETHDPKLIKLVDLTVQVDQPDLVAAAHAMNVTKCKLSQNHGFFIHGDEPVYVCDSCEKEGACGFCHRLIHRLEKRRAATEATRQALAWINDYPNRRHEFIAALPEIES